MSLLSTFLRYYDFEYFANLTALPNPVQMIPIALPLRCPELHATLERGSDQPGFRWRFPKGALFIPGPVPCSGVRGGWSINFTAKYVWEILQTIISLEEFRIYKCTWPQNCLLKYQCYAPWCHKDLKSTARPPPMPPEIISFFSSFLSRTLSLLPPFFSSFFCHSVMTFWV